MIPVPPMSLVNTMLDQVGAFVPRLVAALVVMIVGIIVARIVGRVIRVGLGTAGLDRMADRWGVSDAIERVGMGRSLTSLLAGLVRAIILFVVALIAVSVLGLPALEQSMNEAILFIPRLVVAMAIMMGGLVAANAVRNRVERLSRQMDLGNSLGIVAMVGVLTIAAIIAAAQVGIPTLVLVMLATTVVGGLALTVALSIGLGTRHVVGQLAAGRYLGDQLRPGLRVRVGDTEGEILSMKGPATTLRTDDGHVVRVPNRVMLESLVTLREPREGTEPPPAPDVPAQPGPAAPY
ncbi:MAG: mechanosensitive ion channel [Thermoleophilia bacterium]|nr:mechanosensitive ion channel [Thermoleophilia bacterium]